MDEVSNNWIISRTGLKVLNKIFLGHSLIGLLVEGPLLGSSQKMVEMSGIEPLTF